MIDTLQIEIHPIEKSRIDTVDFDNLVFGRSFSDHMLSVDYQNGEWLTPQIIPFSPAMMSLHYGQAIFEGMKAYKSPSGETLVFRPEENWKRLNKSAERMCMPSVPEEIFMEGLSELLRLDSDWIPDKEGCSMYIRPFMFSTDGYVGVSPSKGYKFMIFTCPVGAYYTKPIRVRVETQYIRAAHGGVGFSKNAGNYGASLYPTKKATDAGYDQIIWTDASEHKFVEEAGTMNLLFVIDGKLVTAPTGDTILDGVTRKSVIQVARDFGMEVEERQLSIKELTEGITSGRVQEAFGAGTAAVIAPISTIGFEGVDYELPERSADAFSKRVFTEINNVKTGKIADARGWVMVI